MEPRLKAALTTFPVVVLTGARQAGKTSLCRHIWPKAGYVTLDIPAEAETARLMPDRFIESHPAPVILDEIQYVPDLLRHIKVCVDRDRRPGRFLLTGSQDFLLMQGVTESLAGRCAVLTLPPLTLEELATSAALGRTVGDALFWRGGWPELWERPEVDRELWLGSYLATYLERDVRNILQVGSLREFDRCLRAMAMRVGQLLSMAEIARDVGVAPNTVKKWLTIVEASHQVFLLEPWHVNPGKRLIKTPKVCLVDSGLLLFLLAFRRWEDVVANPAWGALWENLVAAEFRKTLWNHGRREPLYFWRTAAGDEVDLVIETGPRRFVAIECKAAETVTLSDLRGLRAMTRDYGWEAVDFAGCVCRTSRPYPLDRDGRVQALPLRDAIAAVCKVLA